MRTDVLSWLNTRGIRNLASRHGCDVAAKFPTGRDLNRKISQKLKSGNEIRATVSARWGDASAGRNITVGPLVASPGEIRDGMKNAADRGQPH
jgi:hypothetical protein